MNKKLKENLLRSLSRKLKSQYIKAHVLIPVKSTTLIYTRLRVFFQESRKIRISKYGVKMCIEEALSFSRKVEHQAWLRVGDGMVRKNSHKPGQ